MVLVERPEGERPLGRPRRRWEDKTKIDLQKVGWEGIDRIDLFLGQGQVTGCCEFSDETAVFLTCGEFLEQVVTCLLLRKDYFHEFSCLLIYPFIYYLIEQMI